MDPAWASDSCDGTEALSPLQQLLSELCNTIYTTSLLQSNLVVTSLQTLQNEEAHFASIYKTIGFEPGFTQKELCIIRDARAGRYGKDDIEGAFYKYGREKGILALILLYRESGLISRKWRDIHEGFRPWFVNRAVRSVDEKMITRSAQLLLQEQFPPTGSLKFFGRNPGRKEARPLPLPPPHAKVRIDDLSEPVTFGVEKNDLDVIAPIVYLGGTVPKSMLLRATQPRGLYNSAGERDLMPAPDLGPVFAGPAGLIHALTSLVSRGLLHENKGHELFVVPRRLQLYVEAVVPENQAMDKAFKIVLHTFPIDADMETHFGLIGRSYLPQLQHVLRYLQRSGFMEQFSASQLQQTLRSCLSWSRFHDFQWKQIIIGIMNKIAVLLDQEGTQILLSRLQQRRKELSRLYQTDFGWPIPARSLIAGSSNAHNGEKLLCEVQLLVDQDRLPKALIMLETFKELESGRPTAEEERVLQRIAFFRQKIYHFAGDFNKALLCSEEIQRGGVSKQFIAQLNSDIVEIYCELGNDAQALGHIPPSIDFLSESWRSLGMHSRRISLAAVGIYMTTGLKELQASEFGKAWEHFRLAKTISQSIQEEYRTSASLSIVSTMRYFSVTVNLAMIAHLECHFGVTKDWDGVLSSWNSANKVAESLGETLGQGQSFFRMIISYSQSNVLSHLGKDTVKLISESKYHYRKTGRLFHFLNLGSRWFDLIGDWNVNCGLDRLSNLDFDTYCLLQRQQGYPKTEGSSRLTD